MTSSLEDPGTAFVAGDGKGWLAGLPDRFPLRQIVDQRVGFHWLPMPTDRKAALLGGVLVLFLVGGLLPAGASPFRRPRRELCEEPGGG